MTRSYCTLYDKNYLLQGMALYRSLERHARDFKLYVLCMDSAAFAFLQKIQSPSLIPVHVDDLLTPEIERVRARTTHGQFCWVCQPLFCQYLLDRHQPDMVTYLEADSLFFSDPEVLFAELGDRSVSVVPHNYAPGLNYAEMAGEFCVQFNAFRNNAEGRAVLAHWREACFRYDKSAPRKYPGQTCLDDWPTRFAGVAVLHNPGAGVAPWNIQAYGLDCGAVPAVDGQPVVFFHYHQYGRFENGDHELGGYPLSRAVVDCFYRPYVDKLRAVATAVRAVDPLFSYRREHRDNSSFLNVLRSFSFARLRSYLGTVKRKLRGRYNVYPDAYFSSGSAGVGD